MVRCVIIGIDRARQPAVVLRLLPCIHVRETSAGIKWTLSHDYSVKPIARLTASRLVPHFGQKLTSDRFAACCNFLLFRT